LTVAEGLVIPPMRDEKVEVLRYRKKFTSGLLLSPD
jgi:hypothetical protein